MYSVRYYPWFNITAVGLGTYYPWIREHYCTHSTMVLDHIIIIIIIVTIPW